MSLIEKLIDKILPHFEPRNTRYLWLEIQKRATHSTVDFITKEMGDALFCKNAFEVLDYALSLRKPGTIAEFGVFSGSTINHMARQTAGQTLYGFDSFEGLPEQWGGFVYGKKMFDRAGSMPKVELNVKLIKGWFDATVPPFFKENSGPISILHIDCDIYSSTKTVFDATKNLLDSGSIIVFDEFFNYPNYEKHEMKAFLELVNEMKFEYEYLAYSGNQVAVRIK